MKLTERKIETLTVGGARKDRLVFDDSQRGLAVRVTATRSRSYLCQYTLKGQKWRRPVGPCPALPLSKGREARPPRMGGGGKSKKPPAEREEKAADPRGETRTPPPHHARGH